MADNLKQDSNVLDKYERKQYYALPKQPPPANQPPGEYQAISELRGGRASGRFHIVDKNGVSYGCNYAHLIEWIFSPPSTITLMTTTRLFVIEGEHIERIEELLLDGKLVTLREFNATIHIKPNEPNEPDSVVITSIEIQDQR